jgi:hypothetical protein
MTLETEVRRCLYSCCKVGETKIDAGHCGYLKLKRLRKNCVIASTKGTSHTPTTRLCRLQSFASQLLE